MGGGGRRYWRWAVWAVVVFLLGVGLHWQVVNWLGAREWEAVRLRLEAEGEWWTFDRLVPDRRHGQVQHDLLAGCVRTLGNPRRIRRVRQDRARERRLLPHAAGELSDGVVDAQAVAVLDLTDLVGTERVARGVSRGPRYSSCATREVVASFRA